MIRKTFSSWMLFVNQDVYAKTHIGPNYLAFITQCLILLHLAYNMIK